MDVTVVPSVLGTMANLAGDPVIRQNLVAHRGIWDAVTRLLENAADKRPPLEEGKEKVRKTVFGVWDGNDTTNSH